MNIISASGTTNGLSRFSNYTLLGQQAGGGGLFTTAEQVAHVKSEARDPGVTRHRPLTIIGEQSQAEGEALSRIQWEANVRAARSRSVRITVQGWRDAPDGDLWQPGRTVFVSDDWLGIRNGYAHFRHDAISVARAGR